MTYSPVLIQVYDREEHFIKCIDSLTKCIGAQQTVVYIASDAAKTQKSIAPIERIRNYCKTITAFKKLILVDFAENVGNYNSFIHSKDLIFSEYDRMIFTEDDNIFAPNFLEFVNQGLEYYKDNDKVFSICGYMHPFKMPVTSQKTYFSSPFTSAWGVGWWRDKYNELNFHPKGDYWQERRKWTQKMPISWHEIIEAVMFKDYIAGDVVMEYHCLQRGLVNIFPNISLVRNIGTDGTGSHCGINLKYSEQTIANGNEKFELDTDLNFNSVLIKRQRLSIDFPFQSGWKLNINRAKRITKKRIRDYVTRRAWLKKILKKVL